MLQLAALFDHQLQLGGELRGERRRLLLRQVAVLGRLLVRPLQQSRVYVWVSVTSDKKQTEPTGFNVDRMTRPYIT